MAEETVQIAFLKLWQNRQQLNDDIAIDTQLFRIAKTSLIDQLRRNITVEKLVAGLAKNTVANWDDNTGISNLEKKEILAQLKQELDKMPMARRKVFEMSRNQGLSHKQIATELSISVKTVENHINLALKQIRTNIPATLALSLISFIP